MTDPAKALADAARELLRDCYKDDRDNVLVCNYVADDLKSALAAYDAAQVPPGVGGAQHVALWDAISALVEVSGGSTSCTSVARQKAVASVERALDAYRVRPDAGLLRAAKDVLGDAVELDGDVAVVLDLERLSKSLPKLRAEVARLEGKP